MELYHAGYHIQYSSAINITEILSLKYIFEIRHFSQVHITTKYVLKYGVLMDGVQTGSCFGNVNKIWLQIAHLETFVDS